MIPISRRLLAFLILLSPMAAVAQRSPPPSADPLTVRINTDDADRFADLFRRTGGRPTAEQIRTGYLEPGSYGVEVFTPHRIKNAQALAERIAREPDVYRSAIERCLPVVKQAGGDLRAIYLGLRGLFPERPLPQIYIVVGAGNSGGTAAPGAQVLGLEVLCKLSPTPEKLRDALRMFFAHETVHSWQPSDAWEGSDPLLRAVLLEGAADYVASLVLGRSPSAERETWALLREAELWKLLAADLELTQHLTGEQIDRDPNAQAAVRRWVGNFSKSPPGWPYEVGYWMGMRIWQRYVEAVVDKRAAMNDVLNWTDPRAVLSQVEQGPTFRKILSGRRRRLSSRK